MAIGTRPSAQDLSKLIDSLIDASDLAGGGDAQAVEISLQCFDSLKQLQVRVTPYLDQHRLPYFDQHWLYRTVICNL